VVKVNYFCTFTGIKDISRPRTNSPVQKYDQYVQPCHKTVVSLLVCQLGPVWKSLITLFGTLHFSYGINSRLNFVNLVSYSHFHLHLLSHMAVLHLYHLHYHHFHLTRPVFRSDLKTWLFGKSFPPYTFSSRTGLTSRILWPLDIFYSAQRLDLFAFGFVFLIC